MVLNLNLSKYEEENNTNNMDAFERLKQALGLKADPIGVKLIYKHNNNLKASFSSLYRKYRFNSDRIIKSYTDDCI